MEECKPIARGRPRLDAPKEQINIRLDAEVLSLLRQQGPKWQTKINELLRAALGLSGHLGKSPPVTPRRRKPPARAPAQAPQAPS